jgi:hypothetical protein
MLGAAVGIGADDLADIAHAQKLGGAGIAQRAVERHKVVAVKDEAVDGAVLGDEIGADDLVEIVDVRRGNAAGRVLETKIEKRAADVGEALAREPRARLVGVAADKIAVHVGIANLGAE